MRHGKLGCNVQYLPDCTLDYGTVQYITVTYCIVHYSTGLYVKEQYQTCTLQKTTRLYYSNILDGLYIIVNYQSVYYIRVPY